MQIIIQTTDFNVFYSNMHNQSIVWSLLQADRDTIGNLR